MTGDRQNDETILDRVAVMCIHALDPVNTRERVVQFVKDIYAIVTPDDCDTDVDDSELIPR